MPSISAKKEAYADRMNRMLDTYEKVLFCDLQNVRSRQMHAVRAGLRGVAEVLVGKKTLQKKIISLRAARDGASETDKRFSTALVSDNLLTGNLGLVFTNADVSTVRELVGKHRVQAPARVGAISPVDVVIPAGNTGLEPTMTSFFQILNIGTKITKGTVEITADKKVLSIGDKVDNSTAVLLGKLKINPFFYSAEVKFYWDNGLLFTAEDLAVTQTTMERNVMDVMTGMTALSLATGIPTEASFPYVVAEAFKNLLAASVETDYVFEEYSGAQLRTDIKEGKLVAAATEPAASSAANAPAAASAPAAAEAEEEEEDEDFGLGGLF